jgi:3-oxoacyl-[acyl-carrier protein] reductase
MGRAVALAFAREGARIAVNDLNGGQAQDVADEINRRGGNAISIPADVTDKDEVDGMVRKTLSKFGTIDILVNNAGLLYSTPVDKISEKEWDMVMAVNLKGAFLCSQSVLPIMKKKKRGKIINISSSAGRSTSELGGAHYTSAKAGLLGFSRHLARETAGFGINVNAVCPGLIDTPMIRAKTMKKRLDYFLNQIPMKRLGKADEEADLVLFLASEESAYITGATIDINGGSLMM